MSDRIAEFEIGIVLAAAAGLAWFLWKGPGAGLLSGDNTLTRNATDASGAPVTAYQGAGPVGTLGAAANKASGGVLASIGEWLGQKAADLLLPDPMASPTSNSSGSAKFDPATAASTTRYTLGGNAGSSGDIGTDSWSDAAGYGGMPLILP